LEKTRTKSSNKIIFWVSKTL